MKVPCLFWGAFGENLSVHVHTVDGHNPASPVPIPFEGRVFFGHRPIVQHLTGENILYEF